MSRACQPEQARAEIHVFAAGQLGVEPGAELDERHDVSGHTDSPARRPGDARNQLEQRRLAGAVAADDAEARALRHLERDIAQRVDRGIDRAARRAVHLGRCGRGARRAADATRSTTVRERPVRYRLVTCSSWIDQCSLESDLSSTQNCSALSLFETVELELESEACFELTCICRSCMTAVR